ncbi:MAG: sel1 repeat family protein [Prevotellaceae bacterium]|jgi:hypothetical protein|nr:sel1 repeat family protein [Prevotellaceae bacterium]
MTTEIMNCIQPGGLLTVNLIIAYITPALAWLVSSLLLQTSPNKTIHCLGVVLSVLISLSFFVTGYYVLSETGLIITGIAGFVLGGFAIYTTLTIDSGVLKHKTQREKKVRQKQIAPLLKEDAKRGDAKAQYKLALLYRDAGNRSDAKKWFRRSADLCNAWAQYRLGEMFMEDGNLYHAEIWLKKSAEQDNPMAQFQLGELLSLKNEHEQALFWWKKSAEQGYSKAMEKFKPKSNETI